MKFIEYLVQGLLWLLVALSPTLAGVILGFIISFQAGDIYSSTVPLVGLIGFVVGATWAERVRKTIGLTTFFGRLLGTPELK